MDSLSLQSALDFALDAAWQAGRISLGYFQTGVAVERKSDDSPVTRADREAEQKIRELIERHWSGHGIHGEEFGRQPGTNGFTWIVDPIDGTKSFISGVPLYACLIALVQDGMPLVGVAHFPALNETVYAMRGGGCFWNGRRAQVSTVDTLENAVALNSEISQKDENKQAAWLRLCAATTFQRTWGDAYGYALVASGRAEIMLDAVMNVWDCAPFGVILPEAGGTFTDWRGMTTIDGGESLATNGALLDAALAILNPT